LVAAAWHPSAFGDEKKPDLDARLTTIEKRLDRIEELLKQRAILGAVLGVPQPSASAAAPADTRLSLTKWNATFHPAEYRFEEYWHLTYSVKNGYEKAIKLIDGALEFSDLLGTKIYGVRLSPDIRIEPGQEQTSAANYDRTLGEDDQRLRTIPHEDIKVALHVRRIVFIDNKVLEFP